MRGEDNDNINNGFQVHQGKVDNFKSSSERPRCTVTISGINEKNNKQTNKKTYINLDIILWPKLVVSTCRDQTQETVKL